MLTSDLITQLSKQLPFCLAKDRHGLKRQLDALRRNKKAELSAFDMLRRRVDTSSAQYEKRRASFPALNFPDLPVTGKKEDIAQLIKNNQVVIMCGETGSGKTTLCRRLADAGEARYSISCTTRTPRPGERDGLVDEHVRAETIRLAEGAVGLHAETACFGEAVGFDDVVGSAGRVHVSRDCCTGSGCG